MKSYAVILIEEDSEKSLKISVKVKGGPGSGNWGHAGRPGLVGGSGGVGELSYASLGSINKAFLNHFEMKGSPYYRTVKDINTGFCYAWAWVAHEKFGAELWVNDTHKHAFVKYGGKFYGAETRRGVDNWLDLKGLRPYKRGLENLLAHGIDRSHKISPDDFKRELQYRQGDVDTVLRLLKD